MKTFFIAVLAASCGIAHSTELNCADEVALHDTNGTVLIMCENGAKYTQVNGAHKIVPSRRNKSVAQSCFCYKSDVHGTLTDTSDDLYTVADISEQFLAKLRKQAKLHGEHVAKTAE